MGKDQLFKRALLLIKSWCVYEGRTYSGSSVLSTFPDSALTTLILSLFNQYHKAINQPFQALAMFFYEYGCFDWDRCLCSIEVLLQLQHCVIASIFIGPSTFSNLFNINIV